MFSFLAYRDWENACDLLKFQISRKVENRHFNTLSLHAYQNQSIDDLQSEAYFDCHIKNGLALFRADVTYSTHFPAPKGTFRYRHWTFISLQMRLLYYALGLYISRQLTDLPAHHKVDSRYGAHVQHFQEDGKIVLEKSYVYYKKHYQGFYKSALSKVKELEANQEFTELCVVKMDLENFFEQIDIIKLLNLPYVKATGFPIIPFRLFFTLMMHAPKGLPQTCNDPIAGYLSWIYLKLFDIFLADFLQHQAQVNNFSVYRYCDDTHVFLYFPRKTETTVIQRQIAKLIGHCKDFLWTEYGLRLNSKTVYYHLNDEEQRKEYKQSLKSTSFGEDFYIDEDEKTYHFDSTYQAFIQNTLKYLECDLMKGDVESDVKENMKRIYDWRFKEDLTKILDQNPKIDLPAELAIAKETVPTQISGIIDKLDSAHLVHESRVFAFFESYYPAKFQTLLLGNPEQNSTKTYEWAVCHFGLNELYEKERSLVDTPYFDRLKELSLYGLQESNVLESEAQAIKNIAKLLQENIDIHPAKQFEYLSYFICQRRASELTKDYNAATNYFNSECCIMLKLLGWQLSSSNTPKKSTLPYKLNQYKSLKTIAPALHELSEKRNETDISHNKSTIPIDLSRIITKEEYEKLKALVLQEIATRSEPIPKADIIQVPSLRVTFEPNSGAFAQENAHTIEAV